MASHLAKGSFVLALTLVGCTQQVQIPEEQVTYMPPDGYVPDSATAITIAKAVWAPIYGRAHIESEAPFVATLKGDVWYVHGTLPKGYLGGTAEAAISKRDGRILRVIHGK